MNNPFKSKRSTPVQPPQSGPMRLRSHDPAAFGGWAAANDPEHEVSAAQQEREGARALAELMSSRHAERWEAHQAAKEGDRGA